MSMLQLTWLDPTQPEQGFPPVERACREPNGLLAIGGDLSRPRLLRAYRHGIFPWYEEGQPILWWCPAPRAVLIPNRFRLHRSLRKVLRNQGYEVTFDRAFETVICACGAPEYGRWDTWITDDMIAAYVALHEAGDAHSVEVWDGSGQVVGGLYGIAIGRVFFGESMFSAARDASKVALAYLARHLDAWGFALIDCQLPSAHLSSLGAETIPRQLFSRILEQCCDLPNDLPDRWQVDPTLEVASWQPVGVRQT